MKKAIAIWLFYHPISRMIDYILFKALSSKNTDA